MSAIVRAIFKRGDRMEDAPPRPQSVRNDDDSALYNASLDFYDNFGDFIQSLFTILVYYIVGVVFYHYREGWNIVDCIYYITVSSM